MIKKTNGIVLKNFLYSDNKRIITIFCKEIGKKSFLTFNGSQKNSNFKIFQHLSLVNIEFDDNGKGNFLKVKQANLYYPYSSLYNVFEKSSVVFFIAEFLDKLLDQDFIEDFLFDFIVNSLIYFDKTEFNPNFHIALLFDLLHFFGIIPFSNYSEENKYFDIKKSEYSNYFFEEFCLDDILSYKLLKISKFGIKNSHIVPLNKIERQKILSKIIDYYSIHYKHINQLNSTKVLTQLF